jgi:hypothetical protein
MARRSNIFEGDNRLKLLLYGQAGSTKTRTSATAAMDPRTSPALMLEQAGNPISLRDFKTLPDIIHISQLEDYNPFYEWLAAGQPIEHPVVKAFDLHPPYKSLIIDGITEVQRYSFQIVTGSRNVGPGSFPASTEIQHFNKVLGQMVNFARLFFSLPMHVIMTSLEKEDKDETTGLISYKPLLWGQSSGEVCGYAFVVARLVHRAKLEKGVLKAMEDSITDETVSVALFRPSGKYVAKDQMGMGVPFMADPTITKMLDLIEKANPPKP